MIKYFEFYISENVIKYFSTFISEICHLRRINHYNQNNMKIKMLDMFFTCQAS